MKGWKTWAGAILIGLGQALMFFGYGPIGQAVNGVGYALAAVGIGHKIEKAKSQ